MVKLLVGRSVGAWNPNSMGLCIFIFPIGMEDSSTEEREGGMEKMHTDGRFGEEVIKLGIHLRTKERRNCNGRPASPHDYR